MSCCLLYCCYCWWYGRFCILQISLHMRSSPISGLWEQLFQGRLEDMSSVLSKLPQFWIQGIQIYLLRFVRPWQTEHNSSKVKALPHPTHNPVVQNFTSASKTPTGNRVTILNIWQTGCLTNPYQFSHFLYHMFEFFVAHFAKLNERRPNWMHRLWMQWLFN